MKWNELSDDVCPVARGLSVVGDRWTMLILRDCFLRVRRFDEFQKRLGITRHVLSDRLRKLERMGVLERRLYQDRPPRHEYRLTEAGRALHPVMMALVAWTEAHGPCPDGPVMRLVDSETGAPIRPVVVDAASGAPLDPRRIEPRLCEGAAKDPEAAEG